MRLRTLVSAQHPVQITIPQGGCRQSNTWMMPFPFQRRSKTDRTGVPLDGRPRSAKRTSGTTQTGRSLPSLSVDFEQTLQLRYQVFYLVFAKIERVAMRPNRYDADCRSIAPNLQPVLPDRLARCRCHCFCSASQFWLNRNDRSSTLSSINRCAFWRTHPSANLSADRGHDVDLHWLRTAQAAPSLTRSEKKPTIQASRPSWACALPI